MKKLALAASFAVASIIPGQAADLGRAPYAPVPSYAPSSQPLLWNGFYIGGHVGYGWGRSSANFAGFPIGGSPRPDGFFGGGQIGYNFQLGPSFVFGVEADISGADFRSTRTAGAFAARAHMDLFGTVRGRIGYAFGNMLFYGTGGLAWGHNDLRLSGPGTLVSTSRTHVGYTVGGGVEYAFTPNLSTKIEYLYLDFGRRNYGLGLPAPVRYRPESHTIKVGLNYRFNWGGQGYGQY